MVISYQNNCTGIFRNKTGNFISVFRSCSVCCQSK
uniref:Uncharacterized protein n=1 Tax=Arundo donax TaxID=35708 RepID=A0A0A9TWB6_ARUDO